MERRGFLKLLGLGAAAAAALPVDELIDRLAFARSPTTSIWMPGYSADVVTAVRLWDDSMFQEYVRDRPLAALAGDNAVLTFGEEERVGDRITFSAVTRLTA